MRFPNLWLSLSLMLLAQGAFTVAQNFNCNKCEGNGTKTFNRNLNKLFSIFTSNTEIGNGFFNISVGQEPDKVYGIAMCREDFLQADCHNCLSNAVNKFQMTCLTSNESIGFYGTSCMMRFSYKPIFGLRKNTPNCTYKSIWPIHDTSVEKFRQKTTTLLSELAKKAAAGDSKYKYAAEVVNITASLKLYALTLCSPDLSASECIACLEGAINSFQLHNGFLKGAEVYLPSCTAKFENYPFFNNLVTSPPLPAPLFNTSLRHHSRSKTGRDIYIIVGIVFALLTLVSLHFYFSRRKRENKEVEIDSKFNDNDQIRCVDFMQFDFSIILAATCNFSDANILGRGGSAKVYKGVLPGGQEIAVKRLIKFDRNVELNFNNEVLLLTNLQHRNLVKLLGFCVQNDWRLLIYEFMPNQSLDMFLNDANLNWEIRCDIIQGIARGISYLHDDSQLRVIHRDLKPNNILLDADMKPKISNFSRASYILEHQTRGATTHTSTIKGTFGYMPPEFVRQGSFSVKSDVFSFGVLILEIICGQMITEFSKGEKDEDLLNYVWSKWNEGTALDVVDISIMQKIEDHKLQILRFINIGLLCVQGNPTHRPTMAVVRSMLNNDSITDKREPSKPEKVLYLDQRGIEIKHPLFNNCP